MDSRKFSRSIFILLTIIVLGVFFWLRSPGSGQGWHSVIGSDGRGYYAYLPALFIYQDPSFHRCVAAERRLLDDPDYIPEYLSGTGTHKVNKYFIGVALLQLPFFAVASGIAWATGAPLDGYSLPFQVLAGLGAVFYLFFGLWFLQRLLRRFVTGEWIIAFVMAAFTLGTNLLYYTIGAPLMSHVYSFFAVNGFLWAVSEAADRRGYIWYLASGIFFGLVILIRPVNAIVLLLVPLFAGSLKDFLKPSYILLVLLPVIDLALLQSFAWFLQTGSWFVWSYGNEGFNFLHPAIINVLFSFRKGLFIYTPLTLISLTGLLYLYKFNKKQFLIFLIFLIFFIFLLSSWWNWHYGDGFGMRPAIDVYALFAILLAIALGKSKAPVRNITGLLAVACVLLNLFQSWQYVKGIIHPYNMDREKYAYVFLRTDPSFRNALGGSEEIPWHGTSMEKPCFVYREKKVPIDSLSKYNAMAKLTASELPVIPGRYYLSGSFYVRDLSDGAGNRLWFVLSIFRADSVRDHWYGFRVNDIPVHDTVNYRFIHFSLNSPVIANPDALVKAYLWNPSKMAVNVVDFKLEFYPPEPAVSGIEEDDSLR